MPASERSETVDGVTTFFHADGSPSARGRYVDGVLQGHWEWFRPDGTRKRSGGFVDGEPVGEWVTYDAHGAPHKVTDRGVAPGRDDER